MDVSLPIWLAFIAGIIVLLAVDLVGHRGAHTVSLTEAGVRSALWIALGLGFSIVLLLWQGGEVAGQYIAGYLIEYSLSVDNIFVFALIFSSFGIPAEYRHKVLFWGILVAIVLRAVFIFGGAALLDHFHWIIYVFGAFLVGTGIRMAMKREHNVHPERNPVLRMLQRSLPMSNDYDGPHFLSKRTGVTVATPMLAVLVVLSTVDLVFALDSIPAIFGVTRETFIVVTSNAFAVLGLRTLYFLLEGVMDRFSLLKYGLAAVLCFVGGKMLLSGVYEIPIWASLVFIALALGISIALSLRLGAPKPSGSRRRSSA